MLCTPHAHKLRTGPTRSDTWDTVVPEAAPRYKTFEPGPIQMFSTPPTIAAASLERKGFQTRYSTFLPSASSTFTVFSPYTVLPGTMLSVTRASSLPRATNTPGCLWGSMMTLAPPFMLCTREPELEAAQSATTSIVHAKRTHHGLRGHRGHHGHGLNSKHHMQPG